MYTDNFYENLNKSIELNQAYKYYTSYRNNITEVIINTITEKKLKSITIIGAGNLMDIDYRRIYEMNDIKITVTDIDAEAIDRGIKFYELEESKINKVVFNYLGVESNFIETLKIKLDNPIISEEEAIILIKDYFKSIKNRIITTTYNDNIGYKSELVVVCPIYTQLLYQELQHKLKESNNYHYIKDLILQEMIYIIDMFNQRIVKMISKGKYIFVLSDIIEKSITKKSKEHTIIFKKEEIEEEISTYEKTYGVGLGSYGLINIEEYTKVIQDYYYQWNFDSNRSFLVKGLLLMK